MNSWYLIVNTDKKNCNLHFFALLNTNAVYIMIQSTSYPPAERKGEAAANGSFLPKSPAILTLFRDGGYGPEHLSPGRMSTFEDRRVS